MDQLADLIDSIIATDPYPASWNWTAGDDTDDPYIECSDNRDGTYAYEVHDADGKTAVLRLTAESLREIHRKLTIQLAVIARQNA
jgi:hypothetical protein